jgi:RND family efflux transporter MFP subunit
MALRIQTFIILILVAMNTIIVFDIMAAPVTVHTFAADTMPVTVKRLDDLLIHKKLRAPATVISVNRAIIRSEVTALIKDVPMDVGDTVRKGQTLVILDSDNNHLMLDQSEARLAALKAQIVQAKQRLDKAQELLEKDFISDDELLARETDLAVLEANHQEQKILVRIQELALSRTNIKAPFDAAVVDRQAQIGSYAMPGTALMTIVQTDKREIDVEVDPRYAVQLSTVSGLFFISQGRQWPVKFSRLSNVIETNTRILRARFKFANEPASIGLTGELVWNESSGFMPTAQIIQRGTSLGVFIINSKKAHFIPLPDAQEGRPALIDLSPDTLIVVRGQAQLQDGDSVSISHK